MPNTSTYFGAPYVFEFSFTFTPKFDRIQVAGDTLVDIVPPVGEEWCFTRISTFGDSVNSGKAYFKSAAGSTAPILQPEKNIGDGSLDYSQLSNVRIFCNNDIYISILNENGAMQAVAYDAFLTHRKGLKGEVVSDLFAVAANTQAYITPPAGEEWLLTAAVTEGDGVLSGWWGTASPGGSYSYFLLLEGAVGDGDLDNSCIHNVKIFADNTWTYRMKNEKAAGIYAAYSAIRWS